MERLTALILLLLVATGATPAHGACWSGDDGSGWLRFTGAVEDTEFTGEFGDFEVRYCIEGERPEQGRIEVEVSLASAESGNRDRDQTMKGPEFFAVDQHPTSTWRSTVISAQGDGYAADGELTLKGVTAAQPIRFTLTPDGSELVASGSFTLAGSADVDRQRFDVGTGDFADPEFVRNRVDVSFEVRLARGDG